MRKSLQILALVATGLSVVATSEPVWTLDGTITGDRFFLDGQNPFASRCFEASTLPATDSSDELLSGTVRVTVDANWANGSNPPNLEVSLSNFDSVQDDTGVETLPLISGQTDVLNVHMPMFENCTAQDTCVQGFFVDFDFFADAGAVDGDTQIDWVVDASLLGSGSSTPPTGLEFIVREIACP